MLKLRPYQEQALTAEDAHRREHPDETRLAVVMATGLGKTIVMAERARRFVGASFHRSTIDDHYHSERVLILVHTDELAQQAEAKVRLVVNSGKAFGEQEWTVGVVKAERDEVTADIIIASVQTLARPERRARISDVGLVIVDECHHATAASYQTIMWHFGCLPDCTHPYGSPCEECRNTGWTEPPTPALGFTATLERADGAGLGEIWQNVVFSRDISWAVRHGYLVQPVGHRLEIEPGVFSVRHSGDVHEIADRIFSTSATEQDQQLIEALAPEKIVEKWVELAKDRPTVAFMPLVRSAGALADAFNRAGVSARVIYGDLPEKIRRAYLAMYEAGELQVLVNAMVLTEGWDSPRTKCVIVGRPTKSRALFVQMAGRGLRPAPGIPVEEQDCLLLCVADSTTDLCSIADLSDKPIDRKAEGALTAMEDQWDIGAELADETRFWTGRVDAKQFDPLVQRSSKVWRTTKHGTPFLPISKDGEYVFIVGTSVFARLATLSGRAYVVSRLHKDLPDLELALSVAEDEAQERGGDLGKLLADKNRPWRKQVPSAEMQEMARRVGIPEREIEAILSARAGGKAGKLSDLISKVIATTTLEPMVKKIKERTIP